MVKKRLTRFLPFALNVRHVRRKVVRLAVGRHASVAFDDFAGVIEAARPNTSVSVETLRNVAAKLRPVHDGRNACFAVGVGVEKRNRH